MQRKLVERFFCEMTSITTFKIQRRKNSFVKTQNYMQDAKKNTLSASQRGEIVPPILVQIHMKKKKSKETLGASSQIE